MDSWLLLAPVRNHKGTGLPTYDLNKFLIQAGDSTSPEPRTLFLANRQRGAGQEQEGEDWRGHDFDLWPADPGRSRVPVAIVRRGPGPDGFLKEDSFTYQVLQPDGVPLGSITRERLRFLPPKRARWTLHPVGRQPATARKGGLVRWWIWLAAFPLTAVYYVATAVTSMGEGTPAPRRLILRSGRRPVLDYRPRKNRYANPSPDLDPRLVAALMLIHSKAALDARQ